MRVSNKFTVYNASAGSGKTYTLVKEYLTMLLQSSKPDAYRNILAITFTNKAVAEMKSRVIYNLNGLASSECPEDCLSIMKDLILETGYTREIVQSKSSKILKSILHNYASFDISTIDRFTHNVIRTFAKDLGIPLNFEVELNTLQVLQEAIDRLINRAGEDKDLTKVLVNFTLSKADEDKSWDIAKDLFNFSKILLQETHQKYVAAIKEKSLEDFAQFSKKVKTEIQKTEENIEELAQAFFGIIAVEELERLDFKSGYCYDYFFKLTQKNYKGPFGAKWQLNIGDENLYAAKLHPSKKQILDQYQPQIALLFHNSMRAIFRREYLQELYASITPLSLLSEVANEIENIKRDRSLVLISDFNPTIAAQVQNQPAPFIYERLGERYQNYFIDEFQDTSQMQWENIIPLIDHALTSQQQNGETSGLTLVGDAKQSIYRFRGGRAEQFIELYNEKNPFQIEKKIVNLPNNYRSSPTIIDFNNSFFSYLSQKFTNPTYNELFAGCRQNPVKESEGYVNIDFIESSNAEEEMELHPQRVHEIIIDLAEKNVLKSNICVLTRTRKQSFAVANYLSEKGIAIISSESLLISNSPEVAFMNNLLEYSLNPKDKDLKWKILNYLASRLNIQTPHEIFYSNLSKENNDFFEWLKAFDIHFDLENLKELSLYEAAEYMVSSFSLIDGSNAYIQSYLDFIFEKTTQAVIGVPAFLELWELNREKLSIVAPKTNHAVQIMTIHKSKGLEFPVVIYPFANTKLKDTSKESIWLPLPPGLDDIPYSYFKASKKMLEWGDYESKAFNELVDQTEFDAINILYVAFTRASQKLYILSNLELKKGEESQDKVSGLLIGYLKSKKLWDNSTTYELGTNDPELEAVTTEDSFVQLKNNYSTAARNQTVQLVTKSGELWGSPQEEAINNGILVHDILSKIDTLEDLEKVFEKLSSQEKFSALKDRELRNLVTRVITHPELSIYFSPGQKVYRERDIISPTGEILRPDRLNIHGNEVSIIDYKTGKFQPQHHSQMEKYAEILSAMGFEVCNKILIYINNDVNPTFL